MTQHSIQAYIVTNIAKPIVIPFFERSSNTFSYIVQDPNSRACAIIDSVLDFNYASGLVTHESADEIINYIKQHDLNLEYLIETHVHADHLSAAPYLQDKLGGKIAINENINVIQNEFGRLFNEGSEFQRDGSQFDELFADGQTYRIGNLIATTIHTPGHTPACMTHLIGDAAFVGDTLFMPDSGTARADFPGGDARTLYHSIQKILTLPDETRLFICHDYKPGGRELQFQSTVNEQKIKNIHVHLGISEEEFVSMRTTRDNSLDMPRLIYPSLQINMRAGHFPPTEDNQTAYLKVPISGIKSSS